MSEPKIERAQSIGRAASMLKCDAKLLIALQNAGCPGFDDHGRITIPVVKPFVDVVSALDRPPPETERIRLAARSLELENAQQEAEIRKRTYFRQSDLANQVKLFAAKRGQYRDRVRQRFDGHHQEIFDEFDLHELGLLRDMVSGFATTLDITIKGEVK